MEDANPTPVPAENPDHWGSLLAELQSLDETFQYTEDGSFEFDAAGLERSLDDILTHASQLVEDRENSPLAPILDLADIADGVGLDEFKEEQILNTLAAVKRISGEVAQTLQAIEAECAERGMDAAQARKVAIHLFFVLISGITKTIGERYPDFEGVADTAVECYQFVYDAIETVDNFPVVKQALETLGLITLPGAAEVAVAVGEAAVEVKKNSGRIRKVLVISFAVGSVITLVEVTTNGVTKLYLLLPEGIRESIGETTDSVFRVFTGS